jgi:hypothetical protein
MLIIKYVMPSCVIFVIKVICFINNSVLRLSNKVPKITIKNAEGQYIMHHPSALYLIISDLNLLREDIKSGILCYLYKKREPD